MTLVGTLEEYGYRLTSCGSGREAISRVQTDRPDMVISDLRLPDIDGLQVLHSLRKIDPEAIFILMTGYASMDTAVEALNDGAYAYVTKPFNVDEVHTTIRNALRQQKLARENKRLVGSLRKTNEELSQEIGQRQRAEEALQDSLARMKIAYDQATIYAQELRDEIDQRERAEQALARSERLRRLQVAQEAKEQERRRLAEELHDETLAELASVIVDLGFLSHRSQDLPTELAEGMTELRHRVRGTESKLRQIVQGIFPSVLTNLGLMPALRTYLEALADRPLSTPQPMELKLTATGLDNGRLPEDVEIAVYRVVQQGMINAIQHSQASELEVSLHLSSAELSLSISDDGQGFDTEGVRNTPSTGHFGLVNLRDRIEGLKGSIDIDSQPSVGTTIRATIPVQKTTPGAEVQTSVYVLGNRGH